MKHCDNKIAENVLSFNEHLLQDKKWEELSTPNNNWIDDPVFKNYHKLSNKQKGVLGEYYVEKFLSELGFKVEKRQNSDHDLMIDGYKVEVKFSLATSRKTKISRNMFIMNHVAKTKDWDRLLLVTVNPQREGIHVDSERVNFYWQSKSDFVNYMSTTPYKESVFRYQQSGEKAKNDDYICSGKRLKQWIEMDSVKTLDQWQKVLS